VPLIVAGSFGATGNSAGFAAPITNGQKPGVSVPGSAGNAAPPPVIGVTAMGPGVMMSPTFDVQASEQAFAKTAYPLLRQHCAMCHSEPPMGKGQLPMHASADVSTAHQYALTKINLRQVATSRLVQRQGIEGHNCWGDCKQNSEQIRVQVQAWADAVKSSLPISTLALPPTDVTDAQVDQWVMADKAKVAAADAPYIQYTSLHRLQNRKPSADDMNTARAGISKILNSTALYAPKLVNPVAIDPYSLVYRFDIRDYWGFKAGGVKDVQRAVDAWNRVKQGNINADDQMPGPNTFANKDTPSTSLAKNTPTFPNIAGFFPNYTDGTQLGYTLSRPDVYADVMHLGTNSALLERQLGVVSKGVDSWQFVTVDDAITINKRMLLRSTTPTGFFWKGVDPFAMAPFIFYDRPVPEMDTFSLIKTTPVFDANGNYSESYGLTTDANGNLVGGPQAQASEMIYSLPNGLQGYFIGGAANQIRVDAFPFIVVDPRRGGPTATGFRLGAGSEQRLLTPASCMSCHDDGMNRLNDDMNPYIDANPTKFDAATVAKVRKLYPGTEAMRKQIESDRDIFGKAMTQIREAMIVGMTDKSLYVEPIMFLFLSAQDIFNYQPTASN
jgi:hypothetical protein